MGENKLLNHLENKGISGSYKFFSSAGFKLSSAFLNYEVLKKILTDMAEDEEMFETEEKGKKKAHKFKGIEKEIDFLGEKVGRVFLIIKLTSEVFYFLHSFFDNFAQFINFSLLELRNDALSQEGCHIIDVIAKVEKIKDSIPILTKIVNIRDNDLFKYVRAFNDTTKHQYQIFPKFSMNLSEVTSIKDIFNISSAKLPKFEKNGEKYPETELLPMLKDTIDYCEELLIEFKNYIMNYK